MPSKLILGRPDEKMDRRRKYKIFMDGKELCEISNKSKLEFDIEDGEHTLTAKVDWCGSHPFDFECENETIKVAIKNDTVGDIWLGRAFITAFDRKSYLKFVKVVSKDQ